jgi:hypothetical protein
VVDAAGNAADINPANGLPRDATGNDIQQPTQLTRVNHLIAHATASATAAAIASARPAPVVTAPVRATSVTFARAPGRVNRDIIDFTTKAGDALYKRATKPLFGDREDKFSLQGDDMLSFLDLVAVRAKNSGWDVFNIQTSEVGVTPIVVKHLITEYGEIPMDKVTVKATLIAAAKDRTTQDDDQLFTCLMESITKAARNTVNLKKDEFTIGGEHSGILLLKIIIAKSQVDTRATINLLMEKLYSGMGDIMATHNNNITAFNAEIKELMQKLPRRVRLFALLV